MKKCFSAALLQTMKAGRRKLQNNICRECSSFRKQRRRQCRLINSPKNSRGGFTQLVSSIPSGLKKSALNLPLIPFDASSVKKLQHELDLCGWDLPAPNYLSASVFASFFSCVLFALVTIAAIGSDYAIPALFLSFAVSFLFLYNFPSYAAFKRALQVELDLPIALRAICSQLNGG